MAKQTFTTGQVLTAAQMTSLQQTAMLGGAASAKVASYTLVAADAGTAITMSNASATTITVNTALFAAGDVVNITNLGAGVCTITAGTATVNTSASLALAQYESGTLEFISTSSAVFVKGAGAAAAAAGGANWTLLNSGGTALSGTSTTVSGISSADKIMVVVAGLSTTYAYGSTLQVRLNADAGSNYYVFGGQVQNTGSASTMVSELNQATTAIGLATTSTDVASTASGAVTFTGCNSSGVKQFIGSGGGERGSGNSNNNRTVQGYYNSATVISSVRIVASADTMDAGTVYVYTSA